jgi:ABC-type polysaccharide/polyol phosphate export permease
MFRELYNYRELLKTSVKKEIRGKYKASFLGVLWSFVNPLLTVLVYAIVFPLILKNTQPHYVTFLIIGILPWTWFTTSISGGTNCILMNAGIIKKVYFPREILPISVVTSGLINYLISCLIILIFVFVGGIGVGTSLVALPLVMIIQYILQLGLLFITCAVDIYIRDAEYIINFFVNMLFYGTPVLYSATLFPEKYRWILYLNPFATLINSYRNIFYDKVFPNFKMLGMVFGLSVVVLIVGYIIFKKLEKGFAEEV